MAITSIKDVPEGSLITFRSKDPSDLVDWRGTLESIGTYRSIRDRINPASRNEAVRQTDQTVPSDVTQLTYFLITVDNEATQPTMMVFANEWITPGSLHIITLNNQVSIQIDDPNNDTPKILSILAGAGYSCRVLP